MNKMFSILTKNFFIISLSFFLILFVSVSYFRFIYHKDFEVTYESICNPISESCFIGCEDEECTQTYPYKYMRKHATDITNYCNDDISTCAAAQYCTNKDRICEIKYCDEGSEGCFIQI